MAISGIDSGWDDSNRRGSPAGSGRMATCSRPHPRDRLRRRRGTSCGQERSPLVEKRILPDPRTLPSLAAGELRAALLVDGLFAPDEVRLVLTDLDRAVVGGAEPRAKTLALAGSDALRADHFCERRELGVLNIGGSGKVRVDGKTFALEGRDLVYVGRGSRTVELSRDSASPPAKFYLLSYPAHTEFPTTLVREAQAERAELGSADRANQRVIARYVHPGGARSCQLVMGVTTLLPGSVWNTMPPHTH